jgi:Flp pilus assembly protein TadD
LIKFRDDAKILSELFQVKGKCANIKNRPLYGQFEAALFSLSRQQPAEALKHLKLATAWDKLSPSFLCTQAEVQDQLGQLAEALKTLDQAEAGLPDDPHIPFVRAMILAHNGRNDEAKAAAHQALKIQSNFKPALDLLHKLADEH